MSNASTMRFLLFSLFAFLGTVANAQSVIFSENMGTPTGTTNIANYSNGTAPATFQNKGVLTYGTGGSTTADVRTTSPSSNYAGASGSGNVFFTASGTIGFSIESIHAAAYNTMVLQFGYRKEAPSLHASLSVDYWNGTAWVTLANTAAELFNEAANASTGWYLSKPLSLPADAATDGLKIRFIKSASNSIRIDDVKLTGQINTPTTTSISPSSASTGDPGFTLTVNGTSFINGLSTVTWDGLERPTTFVNATQLTAAIPAADLSSAGTVAVGVSTNGALASSNTQPFTISATSAPVIILMSPLTAFGDVCTNTIAGPLSFTIDGNNLNGSDITLGALAGFSYSEAPGGPFSSTLSFSYSGNSFSGKQVFVQFQPTLVQSYNGSILLNGGGVADYQVAAVGSGINTEPTVTTGNVTSIGPNDGTLHGTVTATGCTAINAYGIEYSTTSGFADGTGTQIASGNLAGNDFSVSLSGLAPNTKYYYKAYAANSAGTAYGNQQNFTTRPAPVVMSAQPGLSYTETFADVANWTDNFSSGVGAQHYSSVAVTGSAGIPSATSITTATDVFRTSLSSGGVQKGTIQVPPGESIVLLSTGSPDNTTSSAIDLNLDFTGVNAGTLSFDYATLNNSTGDRNGSLRVYATTDGVSFTELTFADVLDFTNNVAISGSKTNIALPASFNNNATARIRFYYHNGSGGTGSGSRPKISLDNINVTAVATTPCATPTAAPSALNFSNISDVSIDGSFTAASPAPDEYIVIMSSNTSLTADPVDGQIYSIGDNVGDGSVVARGSATSFTASGLSASSTYYFFIYSVNSVCTGGPLYYTANTLTGNATTAAALPACTAPASQATNLGFGSSTVNSIQGSFTATTADQYLVLRSTASALSENPVDGQVYAAGDVIGNATVVQQSNGTSFTANSLAPGTAYYFFIFSANNSSCINGPAFNLVAPLNGTQSTAPLPPCATPSGQPNLLSFTASNTAVSGAFNSGMSADNYLVVQSTSASLSANPIDHTDYNEGDNIGNGVVVSNGPGNSFLSTNLSPGTNYYYFVFAANRNCSGGTKYLVTSPLTGSVTTTLAATYNYYFGNLHSHSDYSDGNQDHPGFTPTDDYNYAMTAECMDFLGISEHNHFSSPDNPGNTIANYHSGIAEANNFNLSHPTFLALYGMEWGVISGGGHVVVYGNGMDQLFGWESGSGGWGATNNYDVFVAKNDYTGASGLFKTVNDYVSNNTFASLAHPNMNDFNNLLNSPYNAIADSAITATAVESGPSTSTNTTYSNPGSPYSYLWYYQGLLAKGYHLGPVIDHDNHKTTFGKTTRSRTAIVSPALSKADIIKGMRDMHFYATEDCDTHVDFTINTRIMGSAFIGRYAPNILVNISDATTNTSNAVIRLMFGVPGSGITAVKIDSVIGSTLKFTDYNISNLSTGYYYVDIINGSARMISSPIWYTRNDALIDNAVLPVKLLTFEGRKNNEQVMLTWTTDGEVNASSFEVQRSADGRSYETIGQVNAAGNSSATINYHFQDVHPFPANNYYRLKMVDRDGHSENSSVVRVDFSKAYTFTITPNPASSHIVVTLSGAVQQALLEIVDLSGRTIKTQIVNVHDNKVNVSQLAKGMYLVRVKSGGSIYTDKLIIE